MPKKLNISSNERVDLVDFNRAAAEYTQESDNFSRKQLILARRSLIASGFRIELADQTANPGQFTIYNGLGIDRDGNLLNNEDQLNDARTITLSGATTDFYIEVEFVESESDVDGRAFWDPTFSGNTPPGREFTLSVATRLSPDWQISTPVNTSDFDATVNVNSTKIPIAVLSTNGSNQITGSTLVNISTVLEEDAASSDTTFKVVDSTLFPTTGTANLGAEAVTITGNDRTNGIITISPGLTGSFQAGTFFVQTDAGTDNWVPEDPAAVPTAAEDRRRGLFKGDETRGSALSSSPVVSGERSDLLVRNLKDHVDFLSAQIREMKWGSLRADEDSTLPPSTFANTRYYDHAGSVSGARNFSITIGDNTNSWGDLNSAASDLGTIVQQAHDALPANGGSIFIKQGSYVWNSTVNVSKTLKLEFGTGAVFGAGTYASSFLSVSAGDLELVGVPDTPVAVLDWEVVDPAAAGLVFKFTDSQMGALSFSLNSPFSVRADRCVFTAGYNTITPYSAYGSTEKQHFTNCTFRYLDTLDRASAEVVNGTFSNLLFEDCTFDVAASTGTATRWLDPTQTQKIVNCKWIRCDFIATNDSSALFKTGLRLRGISGFVPTMENILFRDCTFSADWATGTTSLEERSLIWIEVGNSARNVVIENCDFSAIATKTIGGTSAANYGAIIAIDTNGAGDDLDGFRIVGNNFGKPALAAETVAGHYVHQIHVEMFSSTIRNSVEISGNSFYSFYKAIYLDFESRAIITNNTFAVKGAATVGLGDISGIEVSSNVEAVISNNTFRIESGSTSTSNIQAAIRLTDTESGSVVHTSNNDIYVEAVAAAFGIYCGSTTSALSWISSNDRIEVYQSGANLAEAWGVHFPFSSGSIVNVNATGGYFRTKYNGTGSCGCIYLDVEDTAQPNGKVLISTNTFIVDTDGSAAYATALEVDSTDNSIICGNTIQLTPSSGTSSMFGIDITGDHTTVDGNNIQVEGSSTVIVKPIKFTQTGPGGINLAGGTSVSGNRIHQKSAQFNCIELYGLFDDLCSNYKVDNNVLFIEGSQTVGSAILVQVGLAGSNGQSGQISVCNNNISDSGINTNGQGSVHIRVLGYLATDTYGCIVSGNICKSWPDLNATGGYDDRAATAAAIHVSYMTWAQVSNNVITNWVIATATDGPNIYVEYVDGLNLSGNVMQVGDGTVSEAMVVKNCDAPFIHGNHCDGGSTDTVTGNTGVIESDNYYI